MTAVDAANVNAMAQRTVAITRAMFTPPNILVYTL